VIKKSIIWLHRLLWTVVVTVLIGVAAYVSLGRYYVGYIERYQPQLIEYFADISGLPTTAVRLSGRWSKLSPVLSVEELTVSAPDNPHLPLLKIAKLTVQLDVISSILNRSVQVKSLLVAGVDGALEESQPGQWQLQGLPPRTASTPVGLNRLIDVILSVEEVELNAMYLKMFYFGGDEAPMVVNELSLAREGIFRRARLQASFDPTEKPFIAIVETQGDPRDKERFSAKAYANLDDVDLSPQLPVLKTWGIDLSRVRIDGEVWVDWRPGRLIDVQGGFSIPAVDIAALSGKPLTPITDLQFNFLFKKVGSDHWRGWVPTIAGTWQDQAFDIQQLQLNLSAESLRVSFPELNLQTASRHLLSSALLDDGIASVLESLAVSGRLTDVQLDFIPLGIAPPERVLVDVDQPEQAKVSVQASEPKPPLFTLKGRLADVAVEPWHGAPGADGVTGYIEMTPYTGLVELDSQNMSMEFPAIYQQPFLFNSIKGQLRWAVANDRIHLNSGPLYVTAGYGPATALLSLDLPLHAHAEESPKMTLAVGLADTQASYRNQFIPHILNTEFLAWMADSVPVGHIVDAGFIYRGSLSKGDADGRTVQLYLNVDDATLNFSPDWPMLTQISGLVEVSDTDVSVVTSQGKMFDLNVPAATVKVKPLAEGGMWLTVDTRASGNTADALKVVNESVLSKMVGDSFKTWVADGEVEAKIALGIPLANAKREAEINVQTQLTNTRLTIPAYKIAFSQLSGPINYSSQEGISSSGIDAQLYHKPIHAKITQGEDKAVNIDLNGRVNIRDIENWSQQAALVFAQGETAFDAKISIAPQGESRFSVYSSLSGITLDLPAPYAKSAQQSLGFSLQLPLTQNQSLLQMTLANTAKLQFKLQQGQLQSGLVLLDWLDNPESIEHEQGALIVTGHVQDFVYQQWRPVLARFQQANEKIAAVKQKQLAKEPATAELLLKVKDLNVANFYGFNQHYEQSVVNMLREKDAWWLSASNKLLDGELHIFDQADKPFVVKMNRFTLPEFASAGDESKPLSIDDFSGIQLDLTVADLIVGDEHFGNISLQLRSDDNAVRFDNISGSIRGVRVDNKKPATVEWLRSEQGEHSRLVGEFLVDDLGDVVERFNYERIIESKSGQASLDLSWPGSPAQWQLQHSEGVIYTKIQNGRFLKASDTATGTLKVVGILNFSNIIRRLQLDFSDVYKSGISFDQIEGKAVLADSVLTIVDELKVKTPSSGFVLRGDANLKHQNLDMDMIATLPIVNNLPWLVALAGGLPTAAGVYVASKIFEDQVDQLSSAVYSVKGDWNNPELKFERIFDDKKSKAK